MLKVVVDDIWSDVPMIHGGHEPPLRTLADRKPPKGIPNDAKLLQDDFEIRILHVFTILFYHLRSQLLVYLLVLNIGISNV